MLKISYIKNKRNDVAEIQREISISKLVGKTETGVELKKPKTKTSIRKVSFPVQITLLIMKYAKQRRAKTDSSLLLVYFS